MDSRSRSQSAFFFRFIINRKLLRAARTQQHYIFASAETRGDDFFQLSHTERLFCLSAAIKKRMLTFERAHCTKSAITRDSTRRRPDNNFIHCP